VSTLLIEGGHPLSGTVEVEGNKNAALPLLAACLLTTEECVLTNVPRISDVEVMARLLVDLGAQVDGIGSTTLRVRCRVVLKDEPDDALVGRLRGSVRQTMHSWEGCAARCCFSDRCSRGADARDSRNQAAIFRRAGRSRRTSRRCWRWAHSSCRAPATISRRPMACAPRQSICSKHR
jgi:hypothetical protein